MATALAQQADSSSLGREKEENLSVDAENYGWSIIASNLQF